MQILICMWSGWLILTMANNWKCNHAEKKKSPLIHQRTGMPCSFFSTNCIVKVYQLMTQIRIPLKDRRMLHRPDYSWKARWDPKLKQHRSTQMFETSSIQPKTSCCNHSMIHIKAMDWPKITPDTTKKGRMGTTWHPITPNISQEYHQ